MFPTIKVPSVDSYRQITNIVATAHALATKKECPIQIEHLQKAIDINKRFVREFYGKDKVDGMYH